MEQGKAANNTSFLRELLPLAVPIVLQSLFSTAVGLADSFMLNFVGQDELAAVSLANQPQFVLSLFYLGLTSGTGVMMAQYLGKKDSSAVHYIFKFALCLTVSISLVFTVLAVGFPSLVMGIFTNQPALVGIGSSYLRVIGVTYLLSAVSQVYLATLKTHHLVKKSFAFSAATLLLNVLLNAVFIWGLFGAPRLGVAGVAIATVIARAVECLLCLADWARTKLVSLEGKGSAKLRRDHCNITFPVMLQGFVWGGAMAVLSAIMGRLGSDVVAANSVASSIQSLATVASFGLAEAGCILLGHSLGKGKLAQAKKDSRTLLKVSVGAGVVCCLLMLLAENPVVSLLRFHDTAIGYFRVMYKMLAVNGVFAAVTYTTLNGIFPSGGYTKYGLYLDGAVMWGFCVLLGSLAAFVFRLPPLAVFVIVNLDEAIKTPIVLLQYAKGKWINDLTEKENAA